jgi:hypothetical protein
MPFCVCRVLCRASFFDLYASSEPKAKDADKDDWVQWVDVRDVIRKCAAKGEKQPVPPGEPLSSSSADRE